MLLLYCALYPSKGISNVILLLKAKASLILRGSMQGGVVVWVGWGLVELERNKNNPCRIQTAQQENKKKRKNSTLVKSTKNCNFVAWVTKLILRWKIKFHRDFQTKFDTSLIYNIFYNSIFVCINSSSELVGEAQS